jgi:hypothetical protein
LNPDSLAHQPVASHCKYVFYKVLNSGFCADSFGPVTDQTEVIAKFAVKWFIGTSLNLGFHIGLLFKLLQVLWPLH